MSSLSALGSSNLLTLFGTSDSLVSSQYRTDPLVALKNADRTRDASIARTAKDPSVERDVAAFRKALANAKDLDAFLADPQARKVFLTANDLADQTSYKALAKKILGSDPSNKGSLVNKVTDTRWKPVVATYKFATDGLKLLKDEKAQQKIADGYAEIVWRKSLDKTTPGLSKALAFRDDAATFKTAYDILGDPLARDVVTVALGIPKAFAVQSVETQARAITSRLDITRLQDRKFVDQFTQRYLLAAADATSSATASSSTLTNLAVSARGLVI